MRKTKIIATLGPVTDSPEMIGRLIDAGLNIFRLNMSHSLARLDAPRGRGTSAPPPPNAIVCIGILMDTQGPSHPHRRPSRSAPLISRPARNSPSPSAAKKCEPGNSIPLTSIIDEFIDDISVGDTVLVDNGALHMKVLAKHGKQS
jgi:pyruvate kinase